MAGWEDAAGGSTTLVLCGDWREAKCDAPTRNLRDKIASVIAACKSDFFWGSLKVVSIRYQ